MTSRDDAYLAALVRAHLLATEGSVEEMHIAEALEEAVRNIGIGDGFHDLQERESARLRSEGLL